MGDLVIQASGCLFGAAFIACFIPITSSKGR